MYSVIKLYVHVSDNFFAYHQDSPTVHSALVSFMKLANTELTNADSRRLLMMGKEVARNMYSFMTE